MPCSRFVLRLLAYGQSCGIREELVGDLLEEIDRGRSRGWLCRQVIALCGWALVGHLRHRANVTPHGVALVLGAVLLAGVSMTSVSRVLEAWLVLYYATGMLSLFAHMAASSTAAVRGELGDRRVTES